MTDNKKFFSLMSDTTFKYLFKNPKTNFFFKDIIEYYTHLDISKFHLMDNELSSGNRYVSYRLDSLLTNDDESIILSIELNRKYIDYVELRNRRYLHTIAGASKNNKYTDKRKVIQLNLCCYLSKDREELSTEKFLLHDIENDIRIDDFIIYNVFIPKEIEICYNNSIKNKLKLFTCDSYEKMKEVVDNDKELKIIMTELERLNNDKYFGALYDVEEEQKKLEASAKESGYLEGHSDGLQEGRNIGREENTKELALKMLERGISKEEVSEIVELSLEELENIIKK